MTGYHASFFCGCSRQEACRRLSALGADRENRYGMTTQGQKIQLLIQDQTPFFSNAFRPEITIRLTETPEGCNASFRFELQRRIRMGVLIWTGAMAVFFFLLLLLAAADRAAWFAPLLPAAMLLFEEALTGIGLLISSRTCLRLIFRVFPSGSTVPHLMLNGSWPLYKRHIE